MGFIVTTILASMAYSLWTTLFPIFLDAAGFRLWEVGFTSSLLFSLIFITALPAGFIADLAPVRILMASSLFIQVFFLYAIQSAQNLFMLIIMLILYSFSQALANQAGIRLVTAVVEMERRGLGYSLYMLIGGISRIAGSYLSGYIAERYGYFTLFETSELLLIAAALTALLIRAPHPRGDSSTSRLLNIITRREYLLLVAAISIHDFSIFAAMPYVALFQKKVIGLGPYEIGVLTAIQLSLIHI